MQDELTNMFTQNMNLSENAVPKELEPVPSVNYSISQHYHHSAHVATNISVVDDQQMTCSSALRTPDTKTVLIQHNIDPSNLLSPQLRLFELAIPEQRDRLVELWRIAPPDPIRPDALSNDRDTSLAQEEEEAKTRYERRIDEAAAAPDHQDVDMPESRFEQSEVVEPYMKSGYEILAERDYNRQANRSYSMKQGYSPLGSAVGYPQALDPAFSSGKEWWRDFLSQQPMEFQYGMLDQMNQFRPMEENEQKDDEMMQ